ncbi:flagellar hook-associated protein FlgL [Metabacillus fastidiosus]|uniref:flagellar hook-associated protein FlgL n=1 Tax=Metabacillus fastidiosus TaxID=1458 RepID=UPI002E1D5B3F|nr:flagellar hook-associated protein FlgL [Metabacillus fastidiosus]MED4454452.1 flagellar hook-associated protein FlgL [Metabacillus fastidiosus]
MRVTQSMLASNSLRNLSKSYADLGKYQDQLHTGKKISRPSDDPVVAIKGMFYRTNLTEVEQYQRNLTEAYTWMENSEAGIEQATQVMHRVRELLVNGKNGTNNADSLKAIAVEITQLREDMIGVANTQVAGRYIFNGTDTMQPPITVNNDGTVTLDNMKTTPFSVEVSKGVQLKVNIDPSNVFSKDLLGEGNGDGTGGTLAKIIEFLNGVPNTNHDPDKLLDELDAQFSQISAERSELGARYNRLELIDDRLGNQEVIANRILSANEDVDMERVITNLTVQESVHRASLAASSRIIQPTLIDFLR